MDLVCAWCGDAHDEATSRCPCGGPLDRAQPLGPIGAEVLEGAGTGHARFGDALGSPAEDLVTLGEGGTPVLELPEAGALAMLEGANPTGSYKDRGAATVVAHARRLGAERVVEDSSGNAGAAVAAYAARAGLDCTVFSPEHVTEAKRARMETLGAEVRVVEGPRSGVTDAAHEAAREDPDAYYASHSYPPLFLEGCQSFALDLVDALGEAPDALVTPCAMGSIVLGAHRGFQRLQAGGVVDEVPPIVAVQAAGVDTIAARFGNARDGANRLADGLQVPQPPRGDQVAEALEATGGTALSVTEDETREAMGRLHRGGLLAEASSATALAGLERAREHGRLQDAAPALVLTGGWTPG